MNNLPPLSLYIHIPWCLQKCPYCDFNSHRLPASISEQNYINHLLTDLSNDLVLINDRPIYSIFIGGGTPSLFHADSIQQLLTGIRSRVQVVKNAEITIEANPGTVESDCFAAYQQVGINRISIGIQSFNPEKLQRLGRIHNAHQAINAANMAQSLTLTSFNLDLMHGLPNQTIDEAIDDLKQAISLAPPHLSWYQLTIEPNTLFSSKPPTLPTDDEIWDIYQQGQQLLSDAGYQQYEISAYAKPNSQCQHNVNYWRFGDYLGIGCGAHGKLTQTNGQILRTVKTRHPRGYMQGNYLVSCCDVKHNERPFEFFMNRFRLFEKVPRADFSRLTWLEESRIRTQLLAALDNGYLTETNEYWQVTDKGKLFLNSLLEFFL